MVASGRVVCPVLTAQQRVARLAFATDLYRLGYGSLTAIRCLGEMLEPRVRLYAGAVHPGFLLMQNNVWLHVARVCRQDLEDEGIDTM